ncbi:MAG TPA: glycosyltransferase family 39 protein, partial [Terriglobales bacterium]|nr:glycosyltransferase family 39 protein [Terriglobales bacterium]
MESVSTATKGKVDNLLHSQVVSEGSDGRIGTAIILGVFVLVFGFLAISSSADKAPTVDESVHLVSGYSYLKWGDFRANPEHPPLVKIWAALPLLWLDVKDPRPWSPTWNQILKTEPGGPLYPFATEMVFKWNDATALFFYPKLQMLLLSIVLAVFIFIWSRELFGAPAAATAIFLYGLDPNILAHSTIVHTDLAFAAVVFIGTYFYCRTLRKFNGFNLLLTSLLFGLAAVTKDSFVTIVPIWVI